MWCNDLTNTHVCCALKFQLYCALVRFFACGMQRVFTVVVLKLKPNFFILLAFF